MPDRTPRIPGSPLTSALPSEWRLTRWWALLWVMLAVTAVILPFLFLGNASGHDFEFHISSWMEVARQWRDGAWYPRWAALANYGFGEPRFIFYPPLSWMLGAALGRVLPWRVVPGALVWLLLVLAGGTMLRLAREWLPPRSAAFAAVFFAVNPYHLVLVYYRSAFAELLASALFPLLALCAIRLARAGLGGIAPLAIVFAAVWLANAPAGVIATYVLALLVTFVAWRESSRRVLARGAAAMALGLLLAAIYIVPAAWEQRWVEISQVLASGLRPDQNFLFTVIGDPEHNLFNLKVSAVASAEIITAALAALFFNWRRRQDPLAWSFLSALGLASTILMLPISAPAWKYLPELRFVQFPWRWLFPLNLTLSIFCAGAIFTARRKWLGAAVALVLVATAGGLIVSDAWWDSEDVPTLQAAVQLGQGYEGTDEYAPLGCDRYILPRDAPEITVASDSAQEQTQNVAAQIRIARWSAESKTFTVDAAAPVTLALRLAVYPAWKAEAGGRLLPIQAKAGTGQMLIPVPAGRTSVQVTLTRSWDRTAGAALSGLALAILLGICMLQRRPTMPISSSSPLL